MSTSQQVAEQRRRYLASAHTRRDWFDYVTAVERLRKVPSEQSWADQQPDRRRSSTAWTR
jgi:hypothetical protein